MANIEQRISRRLRNKLLVSYADLRRLGVTYSREHLRRLEADNRFPERIRLSPQRIAWDKSEILAWIKDRAAQRTGV